MVEQARDQRLKEAFGDHLDAKKEHLELVRGLLNDVGASERHTDQSVERLLSEARSMCGMVQAGPLRDAALIASAQRIEHYEIAVYGTLANYARCIGRDGDSEILAEILEEEKDAD